MIKEFEMNSPKYKFFCELCSSGFNRKAHYDIHLKTKKHLRKVETTRVGQIVSPEQGKHQSTKEYTDMIGLLKNHNELAEQRINDKCLIIEQLQHYTQELKQNIESLQGSYQSEKSQNAIKDDKIAELVQLSSVLKEDISKLKQEIENLEKDDDINEKLRSAQETISELTKKNELAESTIKSRMTSYDQMRELCDTMIPKINDYGILKHSYTRLEQENNELLKLREANILLTEENNKINKYANQISNIKNTQLHNEELTKENSKFKKIIREMGDTIKIKNENDKLEKRNDELTKKCKELMIQQRIADNKRREVEYNQRKYQIRSYESDDDGWN